jgi:hypothetical protein
MIRRWLLLRRRWFGTATFAAAVARRSRNIGRIGSKRNASGHVTEEMRLLQAGQ